MKLLKLTTSDDAAVFINPLNMLAVEKSGDASIVTMVGDVFFTVKEAPEVIAVKLSPDYRSYST